MKFHISACSTLFLACAAASSGSGDISNEEPSSVGLANKLMRRGVNLRSDAADHLDVYKLINDLAGKVEEYKAKLDLHVSKTEELEAKLTMQLSQDTNSTMSAIAEKVFESHTNVPRTLIEQAEVEDVAHPQTNHTAPTYVESSVGKASGDWCIAYVLRRDDWYGMGLQSWGGVDVAANPQCIAETTKSWEFKEWKCRGASYYIRPDWFSHSCVHCPTPHAFTMDREQTWAMDDGINFWRACA